MGKIGGHQPYTTTTQDFQSKRGYFEGVVYKLSEPKRRAKYTLHPALHRRCSTWPLWGNSLSAMPFGQTASCFRASLCPIALIIVQVWQGIALCPPNWPYRAPKGERVCRSSGGYRAIGGASQKEVLPITVTWANKRFSMEQTYDPARLLERVFRAELGPEWEK